MRDRREDPSLRSIGNKDGNLLASTPPNSAAPGLPGKLDVDVDGHFPMYHDFCLELGLVSWGMFVWIRIDCDLNVRL